MSYIYKTRRYVKFQYVYNLFWFFIIASVILFLASLLTVKFYISNKTMSKIASNFSYSSEFLQNSTPAFSNVIKTSGAYGQINWNSQVLLKTSLTSDERLNKFKYFLRKQNINSISLNNNVATWRENISSQMVLQKKVYTLLPGESINFEPSFFTKSNHLLVRCLGATNDRLDLPGTLTASNGVSQENYEVSHRGKLVVINLEKQVNSLPLTVTWQNKNSGALIIEGVLPPVLQKSTNTIFITISSITGGLNSLPKTLEAISTKFSDNNTVRTLAWPTTTNKDDNLTSIITGHLPSDLGSTILDDNARMKYALNHVLAVTTDSNIIETSNYRINITSKCSNNICKQKELSEHFAIHNKLDAEIDFYRSFEALAGLQSLFSDISLASGAFFHVDIDLPPLKLTWASALQKQGSIFVWGFADFIDFVFSNNFLAQVQEREKNIQLDLALSSLIQTQKIQKVVILIEQAFPAFANSSKVPIYSGEIIVASETPINNVFPRVISQKDVVGLAFSKTPLVTNNMALFQKDDVEIFITPSGWVSFPHNYRNNNSSIFSNMFLQIPSTERGPILQKIEEYRQAYSLQGIHWLFPATTSSNRKLLFRASFAPVACFVNGKIIYANSLATSPNIFETTIILPADILMTKVTCLFEPPVANSLVSNNVLMSYLEDAKLFTRNQFSFGQFAINADAFASADPNFAVQINLQTSLRSSLVLPVFSDNTSAFVHVWHDNYPYVLHREDID